MKRLTSALVTALLVLSAAPAARAAQTQTDVIVTATDAPGDVRFYAGEGPTASQRGSIDLREVTVIARQNAVRFKVRLREILGTQQFDQMVFIDLKPAATSGSTWTAAIGMSPQQPTSAYANLFLDDTGTNFRACDSMTVTLLRRQDSLRLDVPVRCIPHRAARIKITSFTGYFRSDAGGPWSKDAMRIAGGYLLK